MQRLLWSYLSIAGAGLAYAAFVRHTGVGIPCMVRLLTGLRCPGCGITHMCLALLNGDVALAYRSNRMVFLLIPVLLLLWGRYLYRYIRRGDGKLKAFDNILLIVSIALLVVWGIIRNLPTLQYLNG